MTKTQAPGLAVYQRCLHNLPEIPNEAFYTAKELANQLKYNIMTIYHHIKAREPMACKVGK